MNPKLSPHFFIVADTMLPRGDLMVRSGPLVHLGLGAFGKDAACEGQDLVHDASAVTGKSILGMVCGVIIPAPFSRMSKLLSLAVFLLILWAILWVALKVTGVMLHLLWVLAIILFVFWVIGKIRGNK